MHNLRNIAINTKSVAMRDMKDLGPIYLTLRYGVLYIISHGQVVSLTRNPQCLILKRT